MRKSGELTERNGRGTFSLGQMREQAPPVDPAEACRKSLSLALFGAVGEADVIEIAGKLKEQAKAGDTKAQKLFFELILKGGQPAAAPARVVERPVEVERPVMVESVGADQLRRLVALSCHVQGKVGLAVVAQLTGLSEEDGRALLAHEWFQATPAGYELTPAGRRAVA